MRPLLFVVASVVVACSSSSSGSTTTDASSDTSSDASSDGGTFSCPPSAPADGAPCVTPGAGVFSCEYGGDAHGACTTIYTCEGAAGGGGAHWVATVPSSSCGTNPPSCSPTYGTQEALTCATSGESCDYDEGRCGCESCLASTGTSELRWHCKKWTDVSPGCPSPRALLGTSCTTEGLQCDYAACCRGPSMGPREKCSGGVWEGYVDTGCSCALPVCP